LTSLNAITFFYKQLNAGVAARIVSASETLASPVPQPEISAEPANIVIKSALEVGFVIFIAAVLPC
jgi:hypothetical protein